MVRLADTLAAGDFAAAAALLGAAGDGGQPAARAGWWRAGSRSGATTSPPPRRRFDAMTGNDALAAYGQYHKALALALAGDFVSAEAILAGGEDGPLHLNRAALVAHAQILAQLGREADAIAMLDDGAGGRRARRPADRPARPARRAARRCRSTR